MARLYTMLEDLKRSKLGVPAVRLAERHGWKLRTVYRDLHALEAAGFPVANDGARWKLVDGWEGALPFPLALDERLALHVARQLVVPLRGTRVGAAFERLHERLVGPAAPFGAGPRQGELFRRLRPLLAARSLLAIDYSRHRAAIEALCRGMERGRTLRVRYFAQSRGELTMREIDPYDLYWDPGLEALYLFAYCHLRDEVRTFAVHRFRQVVETSRHYVVPREFSVEAYLGGAFRIWRERNAARVRLAVDPPEAGWVGERRWHASQQVVRLPDGSCELTFQVDGTREIQRFILQLGAAVEVLEPEALRREVAREHAAAARRAARGVRSELERASGSSSRAAGGGDPTGRPDRTMRRRRGLGGR